MMTQRIRVKSRSLLQGNNDISNLSSIPSIQKTNEIPSNNHIKKSLALSTPIIKNEIKKSISCISYKSLPGKINSSVTKINQDSFLIMTNILGVNGYSIMAVFDGHGSVGHLVSDYCKKFFETFFNKKEIYLSKNNKSNSSNGMSINSIYHSLVDDSYSLINSVFNLCENSLTKDVQFNSNLSGCTAVVVFCVGEKLICANAGDSRAIFSSKEGVTSLSFDHKPEKISEKTRILKNGGKVHPIKENGRFVGPCRVWV